MNELISENIDFYRARTFRLLPDLRLLTPADAIEFVNQRGFVYFWPISGITMPNLWTAVAGDRSVASDHDDPGHITWGWKDELLGKGEWYYAKILRKKATMVSMDVAPYFYALSENYGSPEHDYLTLYEQGRLTQAEKTIYETLLNKGPLDTVTLRRAVSMTSQASNSRFDSALAKLQADFKILPVRVSQAGGWRYAFVYDIVARYYPILPELAQKISEDDARRKLCHLYFLSVGAAQLRDVMKLFGWKTPMVEKVVTQLVGTGLLARGLELDKSPGEWIALKELLARSKHTKYTQMAGFKHKDTV